MAPALQLITPTLDDAAVLRVLDDINGDGGFLCDRDALVTLGLPVRFVRGLVDNDGEITSLGVVQAIAEHYTIEPTAFYWGRSRTVRMLSAQIRDRLGVATVTDERELSEAREHGQRQEQDASARREREALA